MRCPVLLSKPEKAAALPFGLAPSTAQYEQRWGPPPCTASATPLRQPVTNAPTQMQQALRRHFQDRGFLRSPPLRTPQIQAARPSPPSAGAGGRRSRGGRLVVPATASAVHEGKAAGLCHIAVACHCVTVPRHCAASRPCNAASTATPLILTHRHAPRYAHLHPFPLESLSAARLHSRLERCRGVGGLPGCCRGDGRGQHVGHRPHGTGA